MNKDKHMNKAKEFAGEGKAYIHCESKNGETQLAVSGDPKAIIYGCYRALKRTNELSGFPFEVMLNIIENFYEYEREDRG